MVRKLFGRKSYNKLLNRESQLCERFTCRSIAGRKKPPVVSVRKARVNGQPVIHPGKAQMNTVMRNPFVFRGSLKHTEKPFILTHKKRKVNRIEENPFERVQNKLSFRERLDALKK
jgi:hypothetical protein